MPHLVRPCNVQRKKYNACTAQTQEDNSMASTFVNVAVPKDLKSALSTLAKKRDLTVSQLIRGLIRSELEEDRESVEEGKRGRRAGVVVDCE